MTRSPRRDTRGETLQIVGSVAFSFGIYFVIGLFLGVLPEYTHLALKLSPIVSGFVVSVQYVATVLTRPHSGRITDRQGPKQAIQFGFASCLICGVLSTFAAVFSSSIASSLLLLLLGRVALGVGESMVATGAIMLGIGKVGPMRTPTVISWNGVATYGALAAGAPVGIMVGAGKSFIFIPLLVCAVAIVSLGLLARVSPIQIATAEDIPFSHVFKTVTPYGLGLALAGIGFGTIATFGALFFLSRHWQGAALALSAFSIFFVTTRLIFANAIYRYGGFRVAVVSLTFEIAGLGLLGAATNPVVAIFGAALTGLGFSLIFPSLGVEAMRRVKLEYRGSALGAYSMFVDFSLFATGPIAGAIVTEYGYPTTFKAAAAAVALALVFTGGLALKQKPAATIGG
jgi:MFS family permease